MSEKKKIVSVLSAVLAFWVVIFTFNHFALKKEQKRLLGQTATVIKAGEEWPMTVIRVDSGRVKDEILAPSSKGFAIGDKVRIVGFDTVGFPMVAKK